MMYTTIKIILFKTYMLLDFFYLALHGDVIMLFLAFIGDVK